MCVSVHVYDDDDVIMIAVHWPFHYDTALSSFLFPALPLHFFFHHFHWYKLLLTLNMKFQLSLVQLFLSHFKAYGNFI